MKEKNKNTILSYLIPVVVATVISGVLIYFPLHRIESKFYDLRIVLSPTINNPINPDINIISIRDQTSFFEYTNIIKALAQESPKAIGLFVNFDDFADKEGAKNLYNEINRIKNTTQVKIFMGRDAGPAGEKIPPPPLDNIPYSYSIIHKDSGANLAEDKITRRALTYFDKDPSLHVVLANVLLGSESNKSPREFKGSELIEEINTKYILINYVGPSNKDNFPEVTGKSILQGIYKKGIFKNKVILIGTALENNALDYVFTPYSKGQFENPAIYLHANIVNSLFYNNGLIIPHKAFDFALTFMLCLALIIVALKTSPGKGVLIMVIATFSFLIFAFLFFSLTGIAINCIHPLLGIFFAYYIFVPYRAISENKIRFMFQKKHEVLQQVDELKNNFLSFISHDLKTPVAKIQGLADMMTNSSNLTKEQISYLDEIQRSTEDLDHFISNIINLTKIEANTIKLNKVSKDVNKILEECISKLQILAKRKNIEIKKDLEPLFSIKLDPLLTQQIFTNLIENAIKYSDSDKEVLIKSYEEGSFVVVQIKDHGFGMDEEDVDRAFTKFYRGKTATTTTIKGSGLGLYQVKYFVELHKGEITLDSKINEGSTFTVKLPLEEV